MGMGGKCVGFICFWQFLQVSGLIWWSAAHFGVWGVPGIFNTPRIISPLGKARKMALNLAFS